MNYAFDFDLSSKDRTEIEKVFKTIIDGNKNKTFILPVFNIELLDELLKRAALENRRSIRFAAHLEDFISHFYDSLKSIYKDMLNAEEFEYKDKYIESFSQLQVVTNINERELCFHFISKRDDKNGISDLNKKKIIKNMASNMTFKKVKAKLVESFGDDLKESVIKSYDKVIADESSTKFNTKEERNEVVSKVFDEVTQFVQSTSEVDEDEQ
jgi:nucleoid DNA-binding protein